MKKVKETLYFFFPIPHTLLISLSLIITIILSYFYLDKPIDAFFQTTPPFVRSLALTVSFFIDPFLNILLWPLIFFMARFYFHKVALSKKILFITFSISAAYLLTTILKIAFGRDRPELWISDHLYGFEFFKLDNAEQSFPSGHATITSAIFFSLSLLFPNRFFLFFSLALIVPFCRVVLLSQYLSDIIAGLLVGFITCQLIYISLQKNDFFKKKIKLPFFKKEDF